MKIFTSIWMVIIVAIVLPGVRVNNNDTVKTFYKDALEANFVL